MVENNDKINLWSFEEYEAFFVQEEDYLKLCVYSSLLFDNWPYKYKRNKHWAKIVKKIGKKLDQYDVEYFKTGFQQKHFTFEDKIIICALFNLVQRIYGFSEEPPVFKLQDKILKFTICFDVDIIILAFNTIFMIGESASVSKTFTVHHDIFFKLSELDITLNDLFPHIKDKIYRPVSCLKMKDCPIETFWEYFKDFKASDIYITLMKTMFSNNQRLFTILKQNSIMVLFCNLTSNDHYHRLSASYDILDLESDRDFIKNLEVDKLLETARNNFINELESAGLLKKLQDLYHLGYNSCIDFYKGEKLDCENVFKKYLSYVRDIDLETKWNFERYLVFCSGYNSNIVHFIFILELGSEKGVFYDSIENALISSDYDKINILTLFETLIRTDNQTIINYQHILKYLQKYLEARNDDLLQCFLKNCHILIRENEECYLEILKSGYVPTFCEFIKNSNVNEKSEIIIILMDILFYLYKKQNTILEPFEESQLLKVCLYLIGLKDQQLSIKCFSVLSYFINNDPLSIEVLGQIGIDNVILNIKENNYDEHLGICLINFIDALSLNKGYANKLRNESVFSSILRGLKLYDTKTPLLPENSLIEAIAVFLRHHPEYNEEYSTFYLDKLEKMVQLVKSQSSSEVELKVIEDFLESFSHLKSNINLDRIFNTEKMVALLVELYAEVSICDRQSKTSLFTSFQMFVSIFGFIENEESTFRCIIPKLKAIVDQMKDIMSKRNNFPFPINSSVPFDKEYLLLMLRGEKMISLISGIVNNFFNERSVTRSLLESIIKHSMQLFLLTFDYIEDMYDHDTMGGSFISSYLSISSKVNKDECESRTKVISTLICLNNTFLFKYAVEEYDVDSSLDAKMFLRQYLDKISGCLEIGDFTEKDTAKRTKRTNSDDKMAPSNEESSSISLRENVVVLFKILQHLSDCFDKVMLKIFCLWLKEHSLFKNYDSSIRKTILEFISSIVSVHIENKYKEIMVEFLESFDRQEDLHRPFVLTTISNFYGHENRIDQKMEQRLSALVSNNYFNGCKNRFRFLMNSPDFIVNNIKNNNYDIFIENITLDLLDYISYILNYHYDSNLMFSLLKCTVEVLTFVKKKVDKEKLFAFTKELRLKNIFDVPQDFETDISKSKLIDEDGYLQIDHEMLFEVFTNKISTDGSTFSDIEWGFFLAYEKYCEVRQDKHNVLVDVRLLWQCLSSISVEIRHYPMLTLQSIFLNINDLFDLKSRILDKKDLLSFYGLENDDYDYFPLAFRNPNLIYLKAPPKIEYEDDPCYDFGNPAKTITTKEAVCFLILLTEATQNVNSLFALSEIVYNCPRYICLINILSLKEIVNAYLRNDLNYITDPDRQLGAKRALDFFSICVHSQDTTFMKCFIGFIKELLNGSVNDICGAILILCNVSNPLNTLISGLEQQEKDRNIYLAFSDLIKNQVLDLFISVISRINENELPNLKELSNNSETLINNLGIKNSNFFLIQNHFVNINSYDVTDFNLNSMNNSHENLLNVALNFIYNILYSTFQKEIDDSGICDIEITEDELEHDFDSAETFFDGNVTEEESSSTIYNDTEDEEVYDELEDEIVEEESKSSEDSTVSAVPIVRSTYLRYETEFKSIDEENKRLVFESISKLLNAIDKESDEDKEEAVININCNCEEKEEESVESFEEEESSEDSSIGVPDGFVPSKLPHEINQMTEFALHEYILNLTDERKSSSLEYKPIDRTYLESLIPEHRHTFEAYEELLKDFYFPEVDMFSEKEENVEKTEQIEIDVFISQKTVNELLDSFFGGKFLGKPQIYNILKIMSLCKEIRRTILRRSIEQLMKEVKELEADASEINFENIRRSLEVIRLMILKFKIGDNFKTERIRLIRCLFGLLKHRSIVVKVLCLLNMIEFGKEIFEPLPEFEKLKESKNFSKEMKNKVILDIMQLSEAWINKKTSVYLKNILQKISEGLIDALAVSIVQSISSEFISILCCDDILMLQRYIESQGRIHNLILMFDFCFSSFFALFKNKYKENLESFFSNVGLEYKSLEHVDFKYLYTLYRHSQGQMTDRRLETSSIVYNVISSSMLDSLHCLIKDGVEKVIRKLSKRSSSSIDYFYMSGLYNVYFLMFSIYEGLINFFCVFSEEEKAPVLERYDELRTDLNTFLNSNIQEINTIFNVERDVFTQNIRFLSRFNIINFVNKHNYFRGKVQELNLYKEGTYSINVRRKEVLSDSVFQIMNKTSNEFKAKKLQVKFSGEEGLDFGGITREWIDLLIKDLTKHDKGLFVYTSEKKTTFLPYRNSKLNPDHLLYFKFVGRVLGKAIFDRITLDLHIDKSAYKYFLGKKCELSDLEFIDPQFYNSLIWMRENTIEDVILITFSFEYEEFGEMQIVDLKPNGRNIPVTDENKHEYIDLIVEYKLFKGIELQLNSIKQGLFEIVDRDLLSIFNENEFELLINGIPDINVDDWMNNTEYHGFKSNSPNIIWFWKAVRSFNPEERAKLLQFCTGSSRVPFEGFSHLQGNNGLQKFSIHKSNSDNVRLPSAHTCFNQLDLPEYTSFLDLRKSLIYAINECSEGFGLI